MSSLKYMLLVILIIQIVNTKRIQSNFNHVRLDKEQIQNFNAGNNLLVECPIQSLASTHTHTRRKRSVIITSWFKGNIKINQFNLNGQRINLYQKIFKIKNLVPSDSGVYSCGIISGSGITVRSHNLTLNVIGK